MGHATRCIPIIHALIKASFEPIIASDGNALLLLQKEFPALKSYELPSYNIRYPKNGKKLKYSLLLRSPSIIRAVRKEKKEVSIIHENEKLSGIISDNRFGVYNKHIPSVYITHQINVFSGNSTLISSIIHQKIIKKFSECWVPDFESEGNLSGRLGHIKKSSFPIKYLNPMSRLKHLKLEKKYNILVLLSGPEPQRSLLETKLINEFKTTTKKIFFVRGVFSNSRLNTNNKNIEIKNYLLSDELEKVLNESELIVCRPGYSSIMDLAVLDKKAFFIPTPGQFEQEYLAERLSENSIAPYASQENFSIKKLEDVEFFRGFEKIDIEFPLELFSLFKSK